MLRCFKSRKLLEFWKMTFFVVVECHCCDNVFNLTSDVSNCSLVVLRLSSPSTMAQFLIEPHISPSFVCHQICCRAHSFRWKLPIEQVTPLFREWETGNTQLIKFEIWCAKQNIFEADQKPPSVWFIGKPLNQRLFWWNCALKCVQSVFFDLFSIPSHSICRVDARTIVFSPHSQCQTKQIDEIKWLRRSRGREDEWKRGQTNLLHTWSNLQCDRSPLTSHVGRFGSRTTRWPWTTELGTSNISLLQTLNDVKCFISKRCCRRDFWSVWHSVNGFQFIFATLEPSSFFSFMQDNRRKEWNSHCVLLDTRIWPKTVDCRMKVNDAHENSCAFSASVLWKTNR